MPGRTTPLATGEVYHIYNRGSDKREIFYQNRDFKRFQLTFFYYQFIGPKPRFSKFTKSQLNLFKSDPNKRLVEIIAYCLMPNHFHFLIKQLKENGIPTFISQICNSYTRYFNTKYPRVGPLFQGKYQNVLIETEEQLIHTSRYIHLNPVVSGLTKSLDNYPWSSYEEYVNGRGGFCTTNQVTSLFSNPEKYREFVESQVDYGTTLEILKHQVIDTEN